MKTLGRILVILAAFLLVMGATYLIVNAGSASAPANGPAFERNGRIAGPDGLAAGFPAGQQPEFRRGEGPRGGGWMFGMIKNTGMIALLVLLIVLPKNIRRKRIRSTAATG